jgi:hypothetical protein
MASLRSSPRRSFWRRLGDAPADEQRLRVVLIEMHRDERAQHATTPDCPYDPHLPYLLTPWDKRYGGGYRREMSGEQ